MIHADFTEYKETSGADPFTLQSKKMLKVFLQYGPVKARIGSMVAYQGDARFEHGGSGGMSGFLKSKMTGEGVPVMDVTGTGEVFLADMATEIQVIYLDNDQIWVNGANVLAFSASLSYDIQRIGGAGAMAGGMYNVTLTGTGYVAITADGPPLVLDVASAPTFADPQAVVMWTSGVNMSIKSDVSMKTLIGKTSGETFQMGFSGNGWVMVQPSEGVARGSGTKTGMGF
ncbi:MAG TPA: AIM24 family protein [Acidimicrobiales bacterium]